MITFDFNNPEGWTFAAIVYLYSPTSEDYADVVNYIMLDMEDANNASGTPYWGYGDAHDNCVKDSRFDIKGTCDHCGAHFHYGAAYMNDAGEFAIVGNICASNKLNLTAHEYQDAKLRTAVKAAKSRVAANKALAALAPNRREALEFNHYIVKSIKGNFRKWHSLSLKQWALIKKIIREEGEKAIAKANEPTPVAIPTELLDGRHTICGVLLHTKVEAGYAYNTFVTKMLVLDDRGFKVWGTLPTALNDAEKGNRVKFDARVEVSNKDECFGFVKRPSHAAFKEVTA